MTYVISSFLANSLLTSAKMTTFQDAMDWLRDSFDNEHNFNASLQATGNRRLNSHDGRVEPFGARWGSTQNVTISSSQSFDTWNNTISGVVCFESLTIDSGVALSTVPGRPARLYVSNTLTINGWLSADYAGGSGGIGGISGSSAGGFNGALGGSGGGGGAGDDDAASAGGSGYKVAGGGAGSAGGAGGVGIDITSFAKFDVNPIEVFQNHSDIGFLTNSIAPTSILGGAGGGGGGNTGTDGGRDGGAGGGFLYVECNALVIGEKGRISAVGSDGGGPVGGNDGGGGGGGGGFLYIKCRFLEDGSDGSSGTDIRSHTGIGVVSGGTGGDGDGSRNGGNGGNGLFTISLGNYSGLQ